MSIGGVAARAGRDEAAVRDDLKSLLQAGILDAVDGQTIEFPNDTATVELLLRVA